MLKNTYEQLLQADSAITLTAVEADYVTKHALAEAVAPGELHVTVLERLNKETEELIAEEGQDFLQTPISYLKDNQEQFIYAELAELDRVRTDAFALEYDDVFKTYTAMFAVALQKKYKTEIQAHLLGTLDVEEFKSSVAFEGKEGVWEMNIALEAMNDFRAEMTFAEVYELLFKFVFTLLEKVEQA
jgi:hypothetical protein